MSPTDPSTSPTDPSTSPTGSSTSHPRPARRWSSVRKDARPGSLHAAQLRPRPPTARRRRQPSDQDRRLPAGRARRGPPSRERLVHGALLLPPPAPTVTDRQETSTIDPERITTKLIGP